MLALRRPAARHARRDAPIQPRGAYATSKRYGEEALLALADEGLCPVILRNGTVYGYSPRMRYDLVVNTFVKDALLSGRLLLHGGGWMWRPLVDVRDVADAMIARLRGAGRAGPRRDLQRPPLELPDPRAGDARRRLGAARRARGRARGGAAPRAPRDYECSNAKLSTALGFIPRHSVLEAVSDCSRDRRRDRAALTDPRGYNIRWLELLTELEPSLERFTTVL